MSREWWCLRILDSGGECDRVKCCDNKHHISSCYGQKCLSITLYEWMSQLGRYEHMMWHRQMSRHELYWIPQWHLHIFFEWNRAFTTNVLWVKYTQMKKQKWYQMSNYVIKNTFAMIHPDFPCANHELVFCFMVCHFLISSVIVISTHIWVING